MSPRGVPRAAVIPEDEESWLTWVTDYATRVARPAWRWYHTRDSRHSPAGFLDLVMVRPPRLIFAELKTERGKITREQTEWMDDLFMCGAWHERPPAHAEWKVGGTIVECYLWRPSDRPDVERILR